MGAILKVKVDHTLNSMKEMQARIQAIKLKQASSKATVMLMEENLKKQRES